MNYDVNSLISNHMELANDIARREWRTAPHALHRDELLSDAYLGLVDAATRWVAYCEKNNYDPAAIQYFKVFASLRIRGTIRDHIRKEDWATRTLRTKSKKLRDAGQDEGLSLEELARRTEMTVAEINKVNARMASKPVSLDAHLATNDFNSGSTHEDSLKDSKNTEGIAFANDILDIFVNTLKQLPEDELIVIVLHYYSKLDFRHISEELEFSELKIYELHANAVLTVQRAMLLAAKERE
jgi:RNA polymerase sigma factor for flagellar operon FliA